MPPSKPQLIIVVNGTPVSIERNENAPLGSVIGNALEESNNVGQPKENWELRDSSGAALDLSKKISEYSFPQGVTLYLSLKAGIGG